MKKLLLAITMLTAVTAYAEYYKLSNVRRVESNLYKADGNIYIETKYCYHYGSGETAILRWEGKYGTNTITWEGIGGNADRCDVKAIR